MEPSYRIHCSVRIPWPSCKSSRGDHDSTTHPPCRITTILVSRFLLELQEANQTVVKVDISNSLQSPMSPGNSTLSFISSLGAFIDPDVQTLHDEDLEESGVSVSEPTAAT